MGLIWGSELQLCWWRNDREGWRKKRARHQGLAQRPKVKRGEESDVVLEESRYPLLLPFFIKLSHNSLYNSLRCARGSPCVLLHAKPQLAAFCSLLTLPQACTSAWSSVSRRCGKPVKCVRHSREASHCFPVITLVKVPPWRRQAWRTCSYVGNFSWGLILHTGSASPAQRIASLSCAAQPGFDFLWQWLRLLI